MTEPMTRVLHELCTEIDGLKVELEAQVQATRNEEYRHEQTRVKVEEANKLADYAKRLNTSSQEQCTALKADVDRLGVKLEDRDERWYKLLSEHDRITLDLYHYIVELAGHRDTAKTKAERVALGHVVERLAEIRGMNDEERRAVA